MTSYISLADAFDQWRELSAGIPSDDFPMLSESWNDYTDALARDGELTALQYHYCPAYDDPMPGYGSRFDPLSDDRDFILSAMGITMSCVRTESRKDADDWDASASHWRVTLRHNGKRMSFAYSMGAAHTGEPERDDCLNAVLRDAEFAAGDFADFCSELGYDEDSRKAYRQFLACKRIAASVARLFTSREQEELRELFESF